MAIRGVARNSPVFKRRSPTSALILSSAAFLVVLATGPAPAASDLSRAASTIVGRLTTDIAPGREGSGRVAFVIAPSGVVAKFERAGTRPDREYLLMREADKPAARLPLAIGAVRVTAVQEEMAQTVLLWSNTTPRPGDLLVPPSRLTIFLAPAADLARHPDAGASLADQALELALSREPRLRVVRLKGEPDLAELASQLKQTGEIGLVLEPVLLPESGGVTLAAKTRSVLSGHTTATYAEALALAAPRVAVPAPATPTPPAAVPPAPQPKAEAAPPGFVMTRKEAEPGEIIPEASKAGPIRSHVTEKLIAITAADLDGDGRLELVGITPNGVFAYRWSDKGFVQHGQYLEQDRTVRYLAVDTGDINGNGRDEIFVTAIQSVPVGIEIRNRLMSLVLERDGRGLRPVARDLSYFLRVARIPGQQRPLLLAQAMGTHEPFTGPILMMAWKANRYVEDGPLPLPGKTAWLYDVTILEMGAQGPKVIASLDDNAHLLIAQEGKVVWEGKENLGPVTHSGFLQTPRSIRFRESLSAITQPRPEEIAERRVIPRKVLAVPPLFSGGKIELITVAHRVHYGLQVRLHGEPVGAASVVGYVASGEAYEKNWETTPVEGGARDVAVGDFDGDGRRDVVLLSALEDRASLSLFLLRAATSG